MGRQYWSFIFFLFLFSFTFLLQVKLNLLLFFSSTLLHLHVFYKSHGKPFHSLHLQYHLCFHLHRHLHLYLLLLFLLTTVGSLNYQISVLSWRLAPKNIDQIYFPWKVFDHFSIKKVSLTLHFNCLVNYHVFHLLIQFLKCILCSFKSVLHYQRLWL